MGPTGNEEMDDSCASHRTDGAGSSEHERLLASVRKGDRLALEALLSLHLAWLTRIALRLRRRHSDPADVVQETLATVLAKLPELITMSSFRPYLFGEAQNAARRVAGGASTPREERGASAEDPYAPLSLQEEDVAAALADLAPEQREVVLLHHIRGLTLDETARALGLPKGTVASRLHRAAQAARIDPRVRRYFES